MSSPTPPPAGVGPTPILRILPVLGRPEPLPSPQVLLSQVMFLRHQISQTERVFSKQYPWITEYTTRINSILDEMISRIRREIPTPTPRAVTPTPPTTPVPPATPPVRAPPFWVWPIYPTPPRATPPAPTPRPTPIFRALPVERPELPLKTRIALRA